MPGRLGTTPGASPAPSTSGRLQPGWQPSLESTGGAQYENTPSDTHLINSFNMLDAPNKARLLTTFQKTQPDKYALLANHIQDQQTGVKIAQPNGIGDKLYRLDATLLSGGLDAASASSGQTAGETANRLTPTKTNPSGRVVNVNGGQTNDLNTVVAQGAENGAYKLGGELLGKGVAKVVTSVAASRASAALAKAIGSTDYAGGKFTDPINEINQRLEAIKAGKSAASSSDLKDLLTKRTQLYAQDRQDQLETMATAHSAATGQPKTVAHDYLAENDPTYKRVAGSRAPQNPLTLDTSGQTPRRNIGEKILDKLTGNKTNGVLNPEQGAARMGNVAYARELQDAVAHHNAASVLGDEAERQHNLLKAGEGLTNDDVVHAVESGNAHTNAAASQFQDQTRGVARRGYQAGSLKEPLDNYVPRIGKIPSDRPTDGAMNLSGGKKFNTSRQTIETVDPETGAVTHEQKYKTHDQFVQAAKALGGDPETDTGKMLNHVVTTQGQAAAKAEALTRLESTPMRDGRPAVAKATEANLNKYRDYGQVEGKLVHPEAMNGYKAVFGKGSTSNALLKGVEGASSISKRLVTLNGLVHAKNFVNASIRNQGIIRTLTAPFHTYSHEDVLRAVEHGFEPAKVAASDLFDSPNSKGLLSKGLAKLGLGKVDDALTTLRSKNDQLLFHTLGDKMGMSTYLHVEGKLTNKLGADEAARVAGDIANQTIFSLPKSQQSVAARETGRLVAFASKYLTNTMKIATNAVGQGVDKTLSTEGQKALTKQARINIVRGLAVSFGTAQAINYKATGNFTWDNPGSDKITPVFYIDKGTGKQYKITNHYGQIGDLMKMATQPATELGNKMAGGVRETAEQALNVDPFNNNMDHKIAAAGESPWQALADRTMHAFTNLVTPAGADLTGGKYSGKPAATNVASFLGVSSSSKAPSDKLATTITNEYNGTLPRSLPTSDPAKTRLEQEVEYDAQNGKQNTLAMQQLEAKIGSSKFQTFMKTAAENTNQVHFDKLSDAQKLSLLVSNSKSDFAKDGIDLSAEQGKFILALKEKKLTDPKSIQNANDFLKLMNTTKDDVTRAVKANSKQLSLSRKASKSNPRQAQLDVSLR